MDMAVISGALTIPDYEARRVEMQDASWLPPRWDWVDPQKDIKAEILALNAKLKSRTQSISERGYDAAQVDAEIASDKKRAESLGLETQQ
jgi:capsid protein